MAFIKVDEVENKRRLDELAKTEEGALAIRNFDLEYIYRAKLVTARKEAQLSQAEVVEHRRLP